MRRLLVKVLQSEASTSYPEAAASSDASLTSLADDTLSQLHAQPYNGMPHHHRLRHLLGTRVAGVGSAIFVFFFFLAFCLLLCVVGVRSRNRGWIFCASTTIFIVVFLVIFAQPKGPAPPAPPQGYDYTIIWLILVLVFICIGALCGGMGVLIFHLGQTFYAKPLSRQDLEISY